MCELILDLSFDPNAKWFSHKTCIVGVGVLQYMLVYFNICWCTSIYVGVLQYKLVFLENKVLTIKMIKTKKLNYKQVSHYLSLISDLREQDNIQSYNASGHYTDLSQAYRIRTERTPAIMYTSYHVHCTLQPQRPKSYSLSW